MNKCLAILMLFPASEVIKAQSTPTATITFRTVSDLGEPVSGAEIRMSTFVRWQPGEGFGRDIYDGPSGTTNAAGILTLSVPSSRGEIRFGAYKSGYYPTQGATFKFKQVESENWMPKNPIVEVVVKPILSPVRVFARRPERLRIPAFRQSIGFDLMKSDWVAPFGRGEAADFIFYLTSNEAGASAPFESILSIRFSNEGDGIQSVFVPPTGGSRLRLPRYSPEDGYSSELTLRRIRKNANEGVVTEERESQNYFFRVRSQKHDGKILSALYGKISGNIEFWENGVIRFAYYLNPEPLSRNMEFDMQRNEIRGLEGFEAIREP